jgi:hypothetical protein
VQGDLGGHLAIRDIAENMSEPALPRFHTDRAYDHTRLAARPFERSDDFRALVAEVLGESKRSVRTVASSNPYALLPDTLAFLSTLVERTVPDLIVEFGSGQSTRIFSDWAALHGKRVISVEHDRSWVEKVEQELSPAQRSVLTMVHAPLRLRRRGLREFFTYESLNQLVFEVRRADFFLLDGPHVSGREDVLYFVLGHCRPGATVVIDDLRLYPIGEMLETLPAHWAECFALEVIDDNSHGLGVLRCIRAPSAARLPTLGVRSVLRSYWRCFLDYRRYGTGD